MKKIYLTIVFAITAYGLFAQWTSQISGVTNTLRSVYFINDSTGWACGESLGGFSPILKTIDGGSSWALTNYPTVNAFRAIHFIDADTGIITDFVGNILRSTDGGTTWNVLPSGTTQPLRSVYFPSHDTGYICGGLGTMLKTVDAGMTWTPQNSGLTTDLINVRFVNNDIGYAVASASTFTDGHVIKTGDGGATWTTVYSDAAIGFLGLAAVSEDVVFAGGTNQSIIKTDNGGSSWNQVHTGSIGYNLRGGAYLNADNVWMVGGVSGPILYTDNGGSTWLHQDSLISIEFLGIQFPSSAVGYTVGTVGTILRYDNPCPPVDALSSIEGSSEFCSGDTSEFQVDGGAGALTYTWTVPSDALIISGQDTSQILVVFGNLSGEVTVVAASDCDTTEASILNVVVNPVPPVPVITYDFGTLMSDAGTGNQWYYNGAPIAGATGSTYTPTQNGTYYVIVTNSFGCNAQSNSIDITNVSIQEVDKTYTVEVFPNPMSDVASIVIPNHNGELFILITDVAGTHILQEPVKRGEVITISRNEVLAGIYFISLIDISGEKHFAGKLIIH